ncbi:hypothetical protein [Amycolatopsis orientalis]|uniref:hypothetical protein n=1 Tax=Amycolatopsis orientalis TaxID=31958 RepID=UPI0012694BE5|nr:hypothetical protein [Amycolatopsis orientalis]
MLISLYQIRLRLRWTCGTFADDRSPWWFLLLAAFVIVLLVLGQSLVAAIGAAGTLAALASPERRHAAYSAIGRALEAALAAFRGAQR